jgi:G:T-mismatch repair DNA endonuclease (very short patch repair protein)
MEVYKTNGLVIREKTLPFARNFCTISGFIYSLFKIYFVDPLQKLFIVKNEFPKKIQSSKEEMELAAFLEYSNPQKTYNNAFSSKCERNFKRAIADILCSEDNEIYFFNECVCHGHDPKLCSITSKKKSQSFFGKTFKQLQEEFDKKMEYVSVNYSHLKINIIWQCQWRSMKKINEELQHFLSDIYVPWPSHHISPREAVRGARIESFALRWRQDENQDEKLYYIDCSSLYPYVR